MKIRALLAGIGVGFVVTILTTPRSGEDTRRTISDTVGKGKKYVDEKMADITLKVAAAAEQSLERAVIQASDKVEGGAESLDFPGAEPKAS